MRAFLVFENFFSASEILHGTGQHDKCVQKIYKEKCVFFCLL